ncbi:MAG: hypothetical protein HFH36_05515 [Lachnospiraceae bacterium]|nr:hypothetical protein [Lachnospiraceae bacterium]
MNEREDYLDRLLRGVEGESGKKGDEDDFFSQFGDPISDSDEDDFLKAFEKSKSGAESKELSESGDDFGLDDIDSIVSNIKNGTLDDLDNAGTLDDGGDLSIDESLKNYDEEDFGLNDVGAGYMELDAQEPEADFEVNTLEGEAEPDYGSGEANQELLDMLSGIGDDEPDAGQSLDDMPSVGGEDFSDEGFVDNLDDGPSAGLDMGELGTELGNEESEMEDLARQLEGLGLDDLEDPASAEAQMPDEPKENEEVKKDKKAKKEKKKQEAGTDGNKPGFFKRLSRLMFGEDDKVIDASDVENLSEEDKEDLQKLADEEEAKEKKKKEKADLKEEKKEQKKKEKEEKKALKAQKQAEKEKKPKKEKKKKDVKVIERSKPLPKGPVILILLVGVSLVILINLLSSQIGYTISISQAQEHYDKGEYVEAYDCFSRSTKVKEVDEELYNKARLTAYVQQQLNSYRVYKKQNMHAEALSALVLGVGRYDKNAHEAAATGAAVEYDNMLESIKKALKKQYHVTLDEARELYAIREKEDFTLEIYKIIDELGLLAEE